MAGTDGDGVTPSAPSGPSGPSGFDTRPPEGFTGGGYGRGMYDPLPPGYGWAPPRAPLPPGWQVEPRTRQILAPGMQPSGPPPEGLLPGYSWIAPGTALPEGWHIDPETDVLIPPGNLDTAPPAGGGWSAAGSTGSALSTPGPQPGTGLSEPPWPQTGTQPGANG